MDYNKIKEDFYQDALTVCDKLTKKGIIGKWEYSDGGVLGERYTSPKIVYHHSGILRIDGRIIYNPETDTLQHCIYVTLNSYGHEYHAGFSCTFQLELVFGKQMLPPQCEYMADKLIECILVILNNIIFERGVTPPLKDLDIYKEEKR